MDSRLLYLDPIYPDDLMTLKTAKKICAALGYTITKKDGEFRVCRVGGSEEEAYYTDSANDAVDTVMIESKGKQ